MVKIAEKERKRHPLTAVFGLLIAVGLFGISYVLTTEVIMKRFNQVAVAIKQLPNPTVGRILISVAVWVFLLALSFGVVAILAGKDPEDTSKIPLPPRESDKKKNKRKL